MAPLSAGRVSSTTTKEERASAMAALRCTIRCASFSHLIVLKIATEGAGRTTCPSSAVIGFERFFKFICWFAREWKCCAKFGSVFVERLGRCNAVVVQLVSIVVE
jgi:hypothetical protein